MPLSTTTDVIEVYSGRETMVIRAALKASALVSRNYQGDLQAAYTTKIPTRNNTVTATSRTRGADWKTAQDTDITLQDFTLDQYSEVGNKIRSEDMIESPLSILRTTADDQGYAHARRINHHIFYQLVNGASGTVTGAETGTKGSTNYSYIDDVGAIKTGGTATAIVDDVMIDNLEVISNFFINADLMLTGEMSKTPAVFMNAPLFMNLRRRILDQKYADNLNFQLLSSGQMEGAPPGAAARVFGMNIFVDSQLNALTSAGVDNSTNQHCILAAAPAAEAAEFAIRPPTVQFLTPQTNQTSPNYVMRSIRQYKCHVTAASLLAVVQIRRTANG